MKYITIISLILTVLFTPILGYEYVLALEKCQSSSNYTIHGLWPQYNSSSWPQFCNTSEHFNMRSLEPIMDQIDKYWLTCPKFNRTEEWFLKHEWLKHGTCTPFNEIEYFSTGLALYQILPWGTLCPPNGSQCLLEVTGIP